MFIYVGGVPGVGKTTVITTIEKIAQKQNFRLERVVGSGILRELAGAPTVEAMRALPEEVRSKLRPEMHRRIYAADRKDIGAIRICDGHFCYFDVRGEEYGIRSIQPWDKRQMLAMAIITASPREILKRRLKESRKRSDRQLNLKSVEMEQQMELKIALTQAGKLKIPFEVVENKDKRYGEASQALFILIKKWTAQGRKIKDGSLF